MWLSVLLAVGGASNVGYAEDAGMPAHRPDAAAAAAPVAAPANDAEHDVRGVAAFVAAKARLASGDPVERAAAANEMGRRGYRLRAEIAAVLRPILKNDPVPSVRAAAGRALGRLGAREAIPELVGGLSDPSPDVRTVVAAALWRLPDESATVPLLARLADSDHAVREWSALALGVIADKRAVPALIERLSDPDRAVRLAAVRSLGRIGDAKGVRPVASYLSSERRDAEEREEAINALVSMKGEEAAAVLLATLKKTDADPARVAHIAVGLGQIGDRTALVPLRKLTAPDQPEPVRKAAGEALKVLQERLQMTADMTSAKP